MQCRHHPRCQCFCQAQARSSPSPPRIEPCSPSLSCGPRPGPCGLQAVHITCTIDTTGAVNFAAGLSASRDSHTMQYLTCQPVARCDTASSSLPPHVTILPVDAIYKCQLLGPLQQGLCCTWPLCNSGVSGCNLLNASRLTMVTIPMFFLATYVTVGPVNANL